VLLGMYRFAWDVAHAEGTVGIGTAMADNCTLFG